MRMPRTLDWKGSLIIIIEYLLSSGSCTIETVATFAPGVNLMEIPLEVEAESETLKVSTSSIRSSSKLCCFSIASRELVSC